MVTLEEAIKKQATLQKEGQELLDKYKVIEIMEDLGEVNIDGSFAYGLMVKPDIDLHIYNDSPDIAKVSTACQKLFKFPELIRLLVSNRQNFLEPQTGMPKGIYIGLKIFYKGKNWNFDIWNLKPEDKIDPETFEAGWHDKLSKKQRDAILLLKHNLVDQGRYPGLEAGMFASADIYRAVMKDGVRTIEELENWRNTHPYY